MNIKNVGQRIANRVLYGNPEGHPLMKGEWSKDGQELLDAIQAKYDREQAKGEAASDFERGN